LKLHVETRHGLHDEDILAQDEHGRADESVRQYNNWKSERAARLEKGSNPSETVFIATDAPEPLLAYADRVEIIKIPRTESRPSGPRFGSLVHIVLRDASLAATKESLVQLARTHGRLLASPDEEVDAAATAVFDALQHSFFGRVHQSLRVHRELPITARTESGSIFEGVIDLAFLESGKWVIADFKTDVDKPDRQSRYRRQVGWYVRAMEQITGMPARGCVLHV
jgi:ATP-dependent exoDNAse (exonuclease V) beta subunit